MTKPNSNTQLQELEIIEQQEAQEIHEHENLESYLF